jgi:glycine oxidase
VKHADILVVGDGVVGLTTALALVEIGCRPQVVAAGPTNRISASPEDGLIAPLPPWDFPELVNRMRARADELLPELVAKVGQATGVDCELRKRGLMLTGAQAAEGRSWLTERSMAFRHGTVSEFEPGLPLGESEAIVLEHISDVRHARLTRALDIALPLRGVLVESHCHVGRLDVAGNIVLGVHLANGRYISTDAVVLAAGADTNRLLFDSGLDPVRIDPPDAPQLLFNPDNRLISHMINVGEGYLVPRNDGRILVGSLAGEEAFGYEALEALMIQAGNWLPALSRYDLEAQAVAPRPGPAGGMPALGAYPQVRGLWINGGHFRCGLGIAPAAAELLAEQMTGGTVVRDLAVRLLKPS